MKNILLLAMMLFSAAVIKAQGIFSNQTNAALEKVIKDYPNQFQNIKGDKLSPESFRSIIEIPGCLDCSVVQHNAGSILSWRAFVFESRNFSQARDKYKEIYNEVKNTIVKMDGERPFILNGLYEHPEESRKYNAVLFELLPASTSMKKLKVNLVLLFTSKTWKVVLNVHDFDSKEEAMSELVNN